MRRPLIGITTSVVDAGDGPRGRRADGRGPGRAALGASYIEAVQAAGGDPLPLPPWLDTRARASLWGRLDGLLLTGGGDIDACRFGEPPHPATTGVVAERDDLELELVRRAVAERVPMLGICRGLQVLNVALGGTLVQDLPSQWPEIAGRAALGHQQTAARATATHTVTLAPGSRLAALIGTQALEVNSFHHQAVQALGRGLAAVAWAPDGVVEALELASAPTLVLGVQWHPEDLAAGRPEARALFAALVDTARAGVPARS